LATSWVALEVGGGRVERHLPDAAALLRAYNEPEGRRYLDQVPITPDGTLVPEDLAVTMLLNSRVGRRAYLSVQDRGLSLNLQCLPDVDLESSNASQRTTVADLIAEVAQWPGFAASVATKVLHKKRPKLVPVLDNQAIFGAYMNPAWPSSRFLADSVKSAPWIREALERIHYDLTRRENVESWVHLSRLEPSRSRIELFDMIWWSHFKRSKDDHRSSTSSSGRAEATNRTGDITVRT
jgi:hypothetical protein